MLLAHLANLEFTSGYLPLELLHASGKLRLQLFTVTGQPSHRCALAEAVHAHQRAHRDIPQRNTRYDRDAYE
jgi:hypothetical protein|eukprot:COSAG06_NODE_9089_length_1989_cov_36.719577_1_plen_72_part_00